MELEGSLALPIDRTSPPEVALSVQWLLPPTVLDGVDWPALAIDGAVHLDPAAPASAGLLDALRSGSDLAADID